MERFKQGKSKNEGEYLSQLISRITKKNKHAAADWGDAVGKEAW